jgi:hypothetical protein
MGTVFRAPSNSSFPINQLAGINGTNLTLVCGVLIAR